MRSVLSLPRSTLQCNDEGRGSKLPRLPVFGPRAGACEGQHERLSNLDSFCRIISSSWRGRSSGGGSLRSLVASGRHLEPLHIADYPLRGQDAAGT